MCNIENPLTLAVIFQKWWRQKRFESKVRLKMHWAKMDDGLGVSAAR